MLTECGKEKPKKGVNPSKASKNKSKRKQPRMYKSHLITWINGPDDVAEEKSEISDRKSLLHIFVS